MAIEVDITHLYSIAEKYNIPARKVYDIFSDVFAISKPINNMSTFKERLIIEKDELNEKRNKLDEFIGSEAWCKIEPFQKSLLSIQEEAMGTYLECLKQRIAWLDKTEPVAASDGLPCPPHCPE